MPKTAMAPILDEIRANFDRALDLDVQAVRERLVVVEEENKQLRSKVDELQMAVSMLRRIASEHEQRLAAAEGRDPGQGQ